MRDITIVMDQSESRRLCILRYLSHLPNGPFTMLRFASSSCRQNTYADYHKNQSKDGNVRTTFMPDLVHSIISWQWDLLYYAATRILEKRSWSVVRLEVCSTQFRRRGHTATWPLGNWGWKGEFSAPPSTENNAGEREFLHRTEVSGWFRRLYIHAIMMQSLKINMTTEVGIEFERCAHGEDWI
jgi:hypothetical protein